ncbi:MULTISPECIES: TrbI/VirB10 family protein [Vibrio]|uniref:Conjugal transfer protein TraB n=2 Tax=Vibrio TaxID=662 RepID=A0A2N7JR16_VIBSP|nr:MULTISPECIES: TrbI/VirB10 family protein [Vibrio]PMM53530.1 conjugal transfer protein TraB [Vibrio splendidus]CAH7350249.1 IncF plasmid conjugative transfer pilus assembly protein TraB [Vibrio chagasii]
MILDNLRKKLFRDAQGEFEQGGEVNEQTQNRNKNITIISFILLALAAFAVYRATRPDTSNNAVETAPPVEFGTIVEPDFTEKDNQSALSLQQNSLSNLEKKLEETMSLLTSLSDETERKIEKAKIETQRLVEQEVRKESQETEERLKNRIKELEAQSMTGAPQTNPNEQYGSTVNTPTTFGARTLPPRPAAYSNDNPDIEEMQYKGPEQAAFANDAFDSHDFFWEESENERDRKTTENYVPTGTFVTAVVTGGADANAGVLGQGDTTPVVFQTVNKGVLPNGKKSHLNDCTITASAYGEISSSRGIVRTNRMSCILENDEILDLPIKGTAFNFGRNGIRGTTILKNGKIVQMAGIAGILTGLGETGQALSQTTSTSALGSTQSINSEDALVNLLGNATSSVGSKLADYYIKLAELYHPIVEINPGAVVNIVFLEGFPLDPVKAEEYEQQLSEEAMQSTNSNQILDIITNTPLNPLAKDMTQQGIAVPPTPFGLKQ